MSTKTLLVKQYIPVGWIGSGDGDARPSSAQEGNRELWDVWQHLKRAVKGILVTNPSKVIFVHHPHHIPSLAAKPGKS